MHITHSSTYVGTSLYTHAHASAYAMPILLHKYTYRRMLARIYACHSQLRSYGTTADATDMIAQATAICLAEARAQHSDDPMHEQASEIENDVRFSILGSELATATACKFCQNFLADRCVCV